ncbi:protein REVEILLE 1 isoform X2 [Manihot esculenta]|uniref:Uncharacterized protein n=1 Tax=Manihot esculenta TaxID=3983 RepID=A0A2C9WMF2_MANES|nr:protein REVEILLE 1 isoform X2 [Manihot esculenta]OAY60575.1 hypothetical protein MANES_01G123100v8 [Manihot esculenta]
MVGGLVVSAAMAVQVRKPYTITKQRERWTEDEHKKFLEALKLYGRAWRRIEEHVGTKTAVQIRSHAQKFFSKVVREASGNTTSSVEPIEIPPPRPKRKPMHPYPRKLVHPLNKEPSIPEQPLRSSSPNFSISEQENQSPTSVLSAFGSDALGSIDSNSPNRSLSPVSCAGGSHPADFTICEPNLGTEDHGSPVTITAAALNEQFPQAQKLDLFPREEDVFYEEGLVEETSTRSLKLFGRTVLVTECQSYRPSSPTMENSKVLPLLDTNEGKPILPWNFMATELPHENRECTLSPLSHGPAGTLYCLQFQKDNSNSLEATPSLPLLAFCGGMPFPLVPFHKQDPVKVHLDSNGEERRGKYIYKEGSGSNSGSVNDGGSLDKNIDGETQSRQHCYGEKELYPIPELKLSDKSASTNRCMKGFVPYRKRTAERGSQSSTITVEEREEQRIRLCL